MWYFAWILGLPLAAVFAVMNAIWLEMERDRWLADENYSEPYGEVVGSASGREARADDASA